MKNFFAGFLFALSIFASGNAFAVTCNDPSGFVKLVGSIPLGDVLVLGPDCQSAQDGGNIAGPPSHPLAHPSSGNLVGSGCLPGEAHSLWWIDQNLCSTSDVWQITSTDPSAIFTATIGGTITPGDVVKLNFTFGAGACIAGASPACDASTIVIGGDTVTQISARIVCAIANNINLFTLNGGTCSGGVVSPAAGQSFGGYALGSPIGYTVINGPGGIAFDFNSNVALKVVGSVSGAATETVTIGNTNCGVRCSYSLDNNPALQFARNSGAAPQPGSVIMAIYAEGAGSPCPTAVCLNYGNISHWVANSTAGTYQSAWLMQTIGVSGALGGGTWLGQGIYSNSGGAPFSATALEDKGAGTINTICHWFNATPTRDAASTTDSICQTGSQLLINTVTDNIELNSTAGVGINTAPSGNTFQSALGGFFTGAQLPTASIVGTAIGANGGNGYVIAENFGTSTFAQLSLQGSLIGLAPSGIGNNGIQVISNEVLPPVDNQILLGDIVTPHRWKSISTMLANLGGSVSGNLGLKCAGTCGSNTFTFPAGTTDLSATGPGVLVQASSGAALTVETLAVSRGGTGDTGTAWGAFTPSYSCGTATFTNNSARFKTQGKTTWLEYDFTISALGSCTSEVDFTLPNTPNSSAALTLFDTNGVRSGNCFWLTTSTTARCFITGGGAYTAVRHVGSGVYENQ